MGSSGVQYKPNDPKLSTRAHKPSRCLFKNLLFGLMALVSLCVVSLMTWVISKSAYQVKTSETPENDVMAASYLISKMDLSVDPCEDFYQYACGAWIQNQWKDDVSVMDNEVDQYDGRIMKYLEEEIMESDLVSYKNVKTLHQACIKPNPNMEDIHGWLDIIFGFTTINEVMNFAAELGVFVFYEVDVEKSPLRMARVPRKAQDLNKSSVIDPWINGLPEDLDQKDTIVDFVNFMSSLPDQSEADTTIGEFIAKSSTFVDLTEYFKSFGLKASDKILAEPQLIEKTLEFISSNFVGDTRIEDLLNFAKTYTAVLVQERFSKLEQTGRNKLMCYNYFASSYFGFTVGSLMLDRENANYTEILTTVQEMVSTITEQYRQIIRESELLSQEGKTSAITKLDNLEILVGAAPWIKNNTHLQRLSYDGELDFSMSFAKMYQLVNAYHQKLKIQSILQSTVSDLWEVTMGPQIPLNAAYFQGENAISIPIGAFIPPYFDAKWPLPMKYGALGSIIGHEITHAFDQRGMQFDSEGLRNELWSFTDAESVKNEQKCLINQYNGFGHQNFKINGTQTLDENFADNGGLPVAYRAYKSANKDGYPFKNYGLDLTSDRIFFLSYAQIRCYKYTMETMEYYLYDSYNSYSPPDFRVIGPIKNNYDFPQAFSCSSKSKMADSPRCRTL